MIKLAFILALAIHPETRQDLEFANAVESFVMAAAPEMGIPEPYRGMIEGLWADKQADRNAASRLIVREIGQQDRWLFWARRFSRAEIAYRSNRALQAMHPCRKCNRNGRCLEFAEPVGAKEQNYFDRCQKCGLDRYAHSPENMRVCDACDGTGSFWARGAWE